MAVKVNNVYIRENASSQYQKVNRVYTNGNMVFGTRSYPVDGINIKYNGYDTSNYYYSITTDNDVWEEGQTMTFVGYLGQTNASSPYEPIGSLFNKGIVTMTSNTGNLMIPAPAPSLEINALYIGVVIPFYSSRYEDLKDNYKNYIYPDGNVISEGVPYISIQLQDNFKAYLTNLPYGGGTIQGESYNVWLVYRGQHKWSGNQLVYGETNWNILTSNITIGNRT